MVRPEFKYLGKHNYLNNLNNYIKASLSKNTDNDIIKILPCSINRSNCPMICCTTLKRYNYERAFKKKYMHTERFRESIIYLQSTHL